MATREKVENKALELKGNAEVRVGKAVGNVVQAKGLADQVDSELNNAGENLKKTRPRIKKATKKGENA